MNLNQTMLWTEWLSGEMVISMLELISIRFIFEIVYCYAAIYWLFPKYLMTGEYLKFGSGLIIISVMYNVFVDVFTFWFAVPAYSTVFEMCEHNFSNFLMWIGLPTCMLLIGYKMLKIGYVKEQEKTALVMGNIDAELRLLKAQIHPHFLFNTLNNIYSFTLDKSPFAGELIAKLSHILQYMTKESNTLLVPLENEIKILKDYMDLEKVRYGDRLNLQVNIEGDTNGTLIAPLLMIAFIENSFKHGASKMLERSFITVNLRVHDEKLFFSLYNNKPSQPDKTNEKRGLGLNNVSRRLELLYPGAHQLKIESDENSFKVEMIIQLKTSSMPVGLSDSELIKSLLNPAHASV